MEVAVDPLPRKEVEGLAAEVEDEALNGGGLVADGGDDGGDHVEVTAVRDICRCPLRYAYWDWFLLSMDLAFTRRVASWGGIDPGAFLCRS